jgi:5-methylcytosine-specific restriction endonuclease McrA
VQTRTCAADGCDIDRIQARGYCAKHYVYWRRAQKLNTQHERQCTECGQPFTTSEARQVLCSRACRSRVAQRRTTVTRYPDRVTLARRTLNQVAPLVIVPTAGEGAWTAGNCALCSEPFVSRLRTITCSIQCQARLKADRMHEKGHRYRARLRAAYVAPVNRALIYLRDEYTCQLCHLPVDMTTLSPQPFAPSLDHVIPLARGGTHELNNVQLAHVICNSIKSDRLTLIA